MSSTVTDEQRRQQRARYFTKKAIASGELIPGICWKCGSPDVEPHHPNYDNPLMVVWTCRLHHYILNKRRVRKVMKPKKPTSVPTYALCTPREAAVMLRVTPRTVSRWCRDGKLRAIKIGRVWRIRTWDGQPIIEVENGV